MNKPFFVLAPMDDVTDTVFRSVIDDCSPADYYVSEFVNVDGLCSAGREKLMPKLSTINDKSAVIAQIWGKKPENFEQIAREISDGKIPGFFGIDLNFGCPDKAVLKNECCSALAQPELRDKAVKIIKATQKGAVAGKHKLPVSIKCRLGFGEIDYSWHELLLSLKPSMLTVHVRTTREMSKVPARWDAIDEVVRLRDKISPQTKIVLNGDIISRDQGEKLAKKHAVDGIMIGRGVFHNPYCFAPTTHQPTCLLAEPKALQASSDSAHFSSPRLASSYRDTTRHVSQRENAHNLEVRCGCTSVWEGMTKEQKLDLLTKHIELFVKTWPNGERKYNPLKKFVKIYISDFAGASALRDKIMQTESPEEALKLLETV